TGPARQLASDLVPATGRGRLPEVTDGEGRAGSLLRILRRKRFVGFPVTLLFCCVLVVVGVCGVVLTYLVHTRSASAPTRSSSVRTRHWSPPTKPQAAGYWISAPWT